MKKSILLSLVLVAGLSFYAQSATVDTIDTHSTVMNKTVKAAVILPDDYAETQAYPVVYLLHGYNGHYKRWLEIAPDIKYFSDLYKMIIVCPDAKNSWYWDSPVNPESMYETYIAKELVEQIDSIYRTINNPAGRAITGFSMGGHGALYLALKHQDLFGAGGSISGCVDTRNYHQHWEIKDLLNTERRDEYSIMGMLDVLSPDSLALIIDCGTNDFFYQDHVALHEKLSSKQISHDFISRSGNHNDKYFANAIRYQLLFMDIYFKGKY